MTIATATLCRAIEEDRPRLADELSGVIRESLRGDPGIHLEFYGPADEGLDRGSLDPDRFVIDGYRVAECDDEEYDHEIRLRASYDHRFPAGGDTRSAREQVEGLLVYKLELKLSALVYTGDGAVFVIPREW